jgi:hypothetical protein
MQCLMPMRIPVAFLLALVCVRTARAADDKELSGLTEHAINESQITLPGSKPFHLTATISESTDRDNHSHNATIEEYWVALDKWRRTIKTAEFSEVLIMNGDKTSETLTGDYYPNWLRQFVTGIFDPGDPLQGVDMSKSTDIPRGYFTPQGTLRIGDVGSEVCRRFMFFGFKPAGHKQGILDVLFQPRAVGICWDPRLRH